MNAAHNHLSSNTNSKMPSKQRSRQPRYEGNGSSGVDDSKFMTNKRMTNEDHNSRGAAMKQVSKRSVGSESSGSKVSGVVGLETEFDLDKHRDYDVPRSSRRRYDDGESTIQDDNLTDEQRAWAGIDEILDDDGSMGEEDVLPEGIMAVLQQSPTRSGHDDGEDYEEEEDSDEDSHDHAMKMFCGYSANEDTVGGGGDLPTLMDSSFSSQFSQESARSVFTYLSRNNIIVQRDIQDGPLKNFLTEMAYTIEQTQAIGEERGEKDRPNIHQTKVNHYDDDDDETEIQLLEEGAEPEKGGNEAVKEKHDADDDTSTSLDPIGQQIVNAIMTEMKRMKESDEYDEDDHVEEDDGYDDEEYDEEVIEDDDKEYYDDGDDSEYVVHKESKESTQVSPRQPPRKSCVKSPKTSPKNVSAPIPDPRDLPPMKDFVPDDECNNSIASLDTFQDDEVDKILTHQNPMAWACFGDLQFDSSHVTEQPVLPTTPLDDDDDDDYDGFNDEQSPYTNGRPIQSIKDQIVSGVVRPSQGSQIEPHSPQSPSKSRRQSVSKSPMKKKKKPPVAGGGAETVVRRQSVRNNGAPATPMRRPKNPTTGTPKVMRKSVSRPDGGGATPTPKVMRKSVKRSDGTPMVTPKVLRKSVSRPDETAPTPSIVRRSVSRQPPPKMPLQPGKKPTTGRTPVAKRNPSVSNGGSRPPPGEGENGLRRTPRKVRPAGHGPPTPLSAARSTRPGENNAAGDSAGLPKIPQTHFRTPSMVKKKKVNGQGAPSEGSPRRSVRKVRPPTG